VCGSIFLNVDNQLPGDTVSCLNSKGTERSWSHPWLNWRSGGKHEVEGPEEDFKGTFGNKHAHVW